MEVVVDMPVVRMSAPPAARTSVATISAVIRAAPRSFDARVILRFEAEAKVIISLTSGKWGTIQYLFNLELRSATSEINSVRKPGWKPGEPGVPTCGVPMQTTMTTNFALSGVTGAWATPAAFSGFVI
jgi:hypothetical protein